MKLPEIPTDNLYKFMALSGIAVIFASFLPFYLFYNLNIKAIRLSGKLEELKLVSKLSEMKYERLSERSYELLKVLDELLKVQAEEPEEQQKIKKTFEELEKLQIQRAEKIKMAEKDALDSIQHLAQWKELVYLKRCYRAALLIGMFALGFGIILTIRGFQFWKEKLQIPQDLIIKQKAEEATKTPRMAKDTKGEI